MDRASHSLSTYLIAFGCGLLSTLLVVASGPELLERLAPEHLPPPAISNRIDLDEKLLFLRRHPDWKPLILGVGSSITARSLDGEPFSVGLSEENRFLNVGIGGAQIHQTRQAGLFFLHLFPEVRTVVQLVVPPDFTNCSTPAGALFDAKDAAAFVHGEMSSVRAYLKYFNPQELIPQALHMAEDREPSFGPDGKLYQDQFGTMPLQMSPAQARDRHERLYKTPNSLDPNCFAELRKWSAELGRLGVRHVVVLPPISPLFLHSVSGAPQFIDAFAQHVAESLKGGAATLVDERSLPLGEGGFADAYHLLWPAAQVFSRYVSEDIQQLRARRVEG
jgi:hypothetical protein